MNDLTKKKLVKQKINSKDRRSRRLQLTAFGKTQLDSMHPAVEKTVGDWLGQVKAEDRAGFFATLRAIAGLERLS